MSLAQMIAKLEGDAERAAERVQQLEAEIAVLRQAPTAEENERDAKILTGICDLVDAWRGEAGATDGEMSDSAALDEIADLLGLEEAPASEIIAEFKRVNDGFGAVCAELDVETGDVAAATTAAIEAIRRLEAQAARGAAAEKPPVYTPPDPRQLPLPNVPHAAPPKPVDTDVIAVPDIDLRFAVELCGLTSAEATEVWDKTPLGPARVANFRARCQQIADARNPPTIDDPPLPDDPPPPEAPPAAPAAAPSGRKRGRAAK